MNEELAPDILPENGPLTRADLDAALDRLEDLVIGAIRMAKYVPESVNTATTEAAENPSEILELPTPERESETSSIKRRRYL